MALFHVDFFSDVLGMCVNMDVILPQKAVAQIGMKSNRKEGKIPTLYLLHGMSDDHTIWQRRTSIERYVSEMGIAVVMPTTHLGYYTNTQYGYRYFDYIAKELPQICHSFFADLSDKREETFAAGLSMGGYGALKLGFAASETFGAVASLSGKLDITNITDEEAQSPLYRGIFGEFEQLKESDNNLFTLADRLKNSQKPLPEIFICCGTEDFLYSENIKMKEHLLKLNIPFTFEDSPGDHEWSYWDKQIQRVLEWLPLKSS